MPERRDFLEIHCPQSGQSLRACAFLAALLLVFRIQAIPQLSSAWIGGVRGDAGIYVWLFNNAVSSLFEESWFNTQIFYPYTRTLAWSDSFLLPSAAAWPFLKLGVPAALIYNLIMLAAGLLNGYLTWRLCFKLTGGFLSALLGGSAFMLFSGFSSNLGHPQLQFAFWLPALIESMLSFQRTPSFFLALRAGLCISLAYLCSAYFAIYSLLALCSFTAALALLRPSRFSARDYIILASGLTSGLLPLLPFIIPYLDVRDTFGRRGIYEFYYFAASIASYFSASQWNLLYRFTSGWSHEEARLFPGVTVLVLAALAFLKLGGTKKLRLFFYSLSAAFTGAALFSYPLFRGPLPGYLCAAFLWSAIAAMAILLYRIGQLERKLGVTAITNRALLAQIFFCALIFFALSFGPLGAPDGNPQKGRFAPGLLTMLYYLFPGMDSLRAVSRSGTVCIFFLSLSLAFAFEYLRDKKRAGAGLFIALVVLIALENFNFVFPLERLPQPPAVLNQIPSGEPAEEALLFLPLTSRLDENKRIASRGDFARINTNYMNWAAKLQLKLVNGYSGQRPKLLEELPRELSDFPDQRSLKALSSIAALRYIIYASQLNPDFSRQEFFSKIDNAPWLKLLAADDDGNYLFELAPQTMLNPQFSLSVPSWPPRKIRLELMAIKTTDAREVEVGVIFADSAREVEIGSALVRAGETWDFYSFNMPRAVDRVRPVKLRFKVPDGQQIFLRQSRIEGH